MVGGPSKVRTSAPVTKPNPVPAKPAFDKKQVAIGVGTAILLALAAGLLTVVIINVVLGEATQAANTARTLGIVVFIAVFVGGVVNAYRWSTGRPLGSIAIVLVLVLALCVFLVIWVGIQSAILGNTDLDKILREGLLSSFLFVALLFIVAPVAIHLYHEEFQDGDASPGTPGNGGKAALFWMTRLRTLLTVVLTIVLLIFVVAWVLSPERVVVITPAQASVDTGTNTTANATANTTASNGTVLLNPFIEKFFTVYMVVIGFYFTASAAEAIVARLKPSSSGPGVTAGPTSSPSSTPSNATGQPPGGKTGQPSPGANAPAAGDQQPPAPP